MIVYTILLLLLGFIAMFFGAKFVVIGLENIANRFGISQLLVGLIILSIGTSLPEIAVGIIGAVDKITGIDPNIDGIVVGNKVGSFFTQITLILGILGLGQSIFISHWELKREGTMMFVSVLVFFLCALDGVLNRMDAIIMILTYILYLLVVIHGEKKRSKAEEEIKEFIITRDGLPQDYFKEKKAIIAETSIRKDVLFFIAGLVILLIGAEITILNAHNLARELYVPEIVIGILIVGLGTSLPELVADLTAIHRNSDGIAIGDILGSNICDILLATATGALLVDFSVPTTVIFFDLPLLFLAIGLSIIFLWTKTLTRREALMLIGFYGVYALLKLILI